jgi:hypothetical protein
VAAGRLRPVRPGAAATAAGAAGLAVTGAGATAGGVAVAAGGDAAATWVRARCSRSATLMPSVTRQLPAAACSTVWQVGRSASPGFFSSSASASAKIAFL